MIQKYFARRITDGTICDGEVSLALEEPLQIMIQGRAYTTIMRLPGDEIALAAGFCFTEGIIDSVDDLAGIQFCKDSSNRIFVSLTPERTSKVQSYLERRSFISQSSCGICGKELLNEICTKLEKIPPSCPIALERLFSYADILKAQQKLFSLTGCVHAAALFDEQGLAAFAEDVGRHNALDKAIGKALFEHQKIQVAVLSSRASFEMVQKVCRAKIPILACVSAPTYLGVELAKAAELTMIGFLRKPNATIYTQPERVLIPASVNS